MKIIYTITRMVIGGAQETAKYMAEHFRERGHDVILVQGTEGGREGQYSVDVPTVAIPSLVRSIRPKQDLQALIALVRLFRRERPDIVHARTAKARFLTAIAARLAGVPAIVQSVHGWSFNNEIDRRRWIYELAEKAAARLYHCNIMVSEVDRDEGYRLGILSPRKTEIIRSGVHLGKMRTADMGRVVSLRAELAREGETIVTLVGRLSMPKTPEVFVRAAARVRQTHRNVRFVIVGDGDQREAVQNLIKELSLSDSVVMLGLRTDVAEIMAASDIIVHSSTHEGLPKTVLEGMAAGKPVVATRVGGVPVAVEEGVSGLLVEPLDSDGLARAIERLIDDRDLRAALVANATKRLEEFSLDRTFREMEALYLRLTRHS